MPPEDSPRIEHDRVGQKFLISFGGEEAVLAYTQINNCLDLHHTDVPSSQRGKGYGEALAAFAFEFARKNGYRIIPSCPFIKNKFLPQHPEYSGLIAEEAG